MLNPLNFISKFIKSSNQKELDRIAKIVDLVNSFEATITEIPDAEFPKKTLEWHIPKHWNAFERNRARAYCIPYSAMVAMDNWMLAMDLLKKGETKVSTPFKIPKKGTHIGFGA